MAARAIWKGMIVMGEARVPVKLYSAVQDRSVRFRLLHSEDGVPLKQRMVNPVTKEPVHLGDTARGLEIESGVFARFSEEELEQLEPEPSREIRITRFVPADAIGHQFYERPYYLGPDGSPRAYVALQRALANRRREGIARWVMRKKRYAGALRSVGGHLALLTLRSAGEVISAADLNAPAGRALEDRELDMAEKFIEALADTFDPEQYRDEYRDRVMQLIELKRKGGTMDIPEYEEKKPEPEELSELLEKSLARIA